MANDPRWSDETEALVAMHTTGDPQDRAPARDVLTALADAGLLAEPGGETREEWAVEFQRIGIVECGSEDQARHFVATGDNGITGAPVRLLRRLLVTPPWRDVPDGD